MVRRPPDRRLISASLTLRRRGLLAAAAAFAVAGCAGRAGSGPDASAGQDDLARLLAASVAAGDDVAFKASFEEGPPSWLWPNLRGVLKATADAVTPSRLRVSWRLGGEADDTVDELGVTARGGRIRDLVPADATAPAWLLGPVVARVGDRATVLAGVGDGEAEGWLRPAESAAAFVAGAGLGRAAASWDGVLRVTVPAGATFPRLTGLDAASADATQAATVLASAASVPRVVVNPARTVDLGASERRVLLIHEGVHAATRSALSTAPLWLTEGLAEWVAESSDAATRRRNAALVRAAPAPTALPSAESLGGPDAARAYALAALAVEAAVARWGRPAVLDWVADPTARRPSEADLTAALRAAAARLG